MFLVKTTEAAGFTEVTLRGMEQKPRPLSLAGTPRRVASRRAARSSVGVQQGEDGDAGGSPASMTGGSGGSHLVWSPSDRLTLT